MANVITSRKSGFTLRGGVKRRESLWLFIGETERTLAAASTATFINSLNAAALALRPFTVVRTRGTFHVRSDQTGALEMYQAALGYAIVSDQASAVGITALPTPFTDSGSDLWYTREVITSVFGFISGVGTQELGILKTYDSKAMRKVELGQDLAVVIEISSISLGANVVHEGRALVKLH